MNDLHADIERLHDDLAAYAIGAMEDDEAAKLEQHLEGCEHCRGRVRWLRPAVDALPAAVQQIEAPPSLRESLMATVRAEAAPDHAHAPATAAETPRAGWLERLRPLMLRPAVGLAAVVLLVAGLGTGWLLRGSDDGGAPGSEFIESEALSTTRASATLEVHGDSATLHVHDLPKLDDRTVYEVWVQRAGVMEPSSTFVLERDGSGTAAVPGPLEDAEGIYVTAEPRGGSRQPTTEPLLTAPLS